MYKRVDYIEKKSIINKLKFMLAIKTIEQNDYSDEICKNEIEYINFITKNKDTINFYIKTIDSLENDLISPCDISLDVEDIDNTINLFTKMHEFESYVVTNSATSFSNPIELDIIQFLFDLNTLYNMEIAKSKVKSPRKIKWNSMKLDTLSFPSIIDYQPDTSE